MTGRYIRLYQDVVIARKKLFFVFIISTLIINLLSYAAFTVLHRKVGMYGMDCSLFIFISSITVFYLFKSLTIQSKIINWIAGSVLAVYLLGGFRYLLDDWFFHVYSYERSYLLGIMLIILTLSTFIVAVLFDKIRIGLFEKPEYWFINQTIKIAKIITRSLGILINKI